MKRINRIAPIQISAETHDSILKNIKQGVIVEPDKIEL